MNGDLDKTKQIMQAVDDDHNQAIICVEVMRPVVFDKEYLARYNNTYSAHITTYMQHALHRDGISCLCRMWDTDTDSFSIPNLLKLLEPKTPTDQIKKRRRDSHE